MAEIYIKGKEKPQTVVQAVATWLEQNYHEPYAWDQLLEALKIYDSEYEKALQDSYYGEK